jgi:hypothetical protein
MDVVNFSWLIWILTTGASIVIIILGWLVIFFNAKKIATRAETKSILDKGLIQLETLTFVATQFWLEKKSNRLEHEHFELILMGHISRLGLTIIILKNRGLDLTFELLTDLSNCSSLDCEKIDSIDMSELRVRGHQINEISMELTNYLVDCFQKKYRPN